MTLNGLLIFLAIAVGLVGLFMALIFIIKGKKNNSEDDVRTGYLFGLFPLMSIAALFYLYSVVMPSQFEAESLQLSGTYSAKYFHQVNPDSLTIISCQMTLHQNGQFTATNAEEIGLPANGFWECCGIDEQIQLYNEDNSLIAWLIQDDRQLIYNYLGNPIMFRK